MNKCDLFSHAGKSGSQDMLDAWLEPQPRVIATAIAFPFTKCWLGEPPLPLAKLFAGENVSSLFWGIISHPWDKPDCLYCIVITHMSSATALHPYSFTEAPLHTSTLYVCLLIFVICLFDGFLSSFP